MLSQLLTTEIFAYLLIFCRVGTGLMLLPGLAEAYVSTRVRLLLALAFALVLFPVVKHLMPPVPSHPAPLVVLVVAEIMVGALIGTLARIIVSATHTAGTIIAMQSGLASAMMMDITQTSQSTAVANLIGITALAVIFAADLHHLLLRALADSYMLFAPGQAPATGDMAAQAAMMAGRAFYIAMQLSAPFIVVGIILNVGAGVMARVMPSLQVFFLIIAPQILVTFFLLMATISGLMLWYADRVTELFGNPLAPL